MNEVEEEEIDDILLINMAHRLCQIDPNLFSKILVDLENEQNTPETMLSAAREIFQNAFPSYNFDEFREKWRISKQNNRENFQQSDELINANGLSELNTSRDIICGNKIYSIDTTGLSEPNTSQSAMCGNKTYNPLTKSYSVRPIVVPVPKKASKLKEEFNTYHFIITKQENQDFYPLNLEMDYDAYLRDVDVETKSKQHQIADESLRKIATMSYTLNKSYTYRLMEPYSQRTIR